METCDRCGPGVRAAWRVTGPGGGELCFCGACAAWYWRSLAAAGWDIWPLGGHPAAPQAQAG
jgi:hypothetical protein